MEDKKKVFYSMEQYNLIQNELKEKLFQGIYFYEPVLYVRTYTYTLLFSSSMEYILYLYILTLPFYKIK